jgi:hypothetical protein
MQQSQGFANLQELLVSVPWFLPAVVRQVSKSSVRYVHSMPLIQINTANPRRIMLHTNRLCQTLWQARDY